jgi:hypothetical protein
VSLLEDDLTGGRSSHRTKTTSLHDFSRHEEDLAVRRGPCRTKRTLPYEEDFVVPTRSRRTKRISPHERISPRQTTLSVESMTEATTPSRHAPASFAIHVTNPTNSFRTRLPRRRTLHDRVLCCLASTFRSHVDIDPVSTFLFVSTDSPHRLVSWCAQETSY